MQSFDWAYIVEIFSCFFSSIIDSVDYLPGVAVIDIEATSLDTQNGAIASIGIVAFRNGKLLQSYEVFAPFKGARIDESAMEVNGFTIDELRRGCKPSDVVPFVSDFMRSNSCHTLAGQNLAFDKSYINAYFSRYKKFNFLSHRLVDMHSIAYAQLAGLGKRIPVETIKAGKVRYLRNHLSATRIYQMLGMPSEPKPHNALNGAVFEFEGLCRLIYKKQVLPQFKKYKLKKL